MRLCETGKLSSTPRAKNVGWRLDYFLVSSRLLDKVQDTLIRDKVRKDRKELEVISNSRCSAPTTALSRCS